MRITGVLGGLLLVVAKTDGLNACLSDDVCVPGATSMDVRGCAITDEDIPDLASCFDQIGRSTIQSVDLAQNELTTLPLDLLDGFEALVNLDLRSNDLTLLAGNFKGATSLEILDLSLNRIASLPAGAFEGLTSLRELDLKENFSLDLVPVDVLGYLPSLTLLDFKYNKLNPQAGNFIGTTSLEVIDLEANQIESIPGGVFEGLTSLRELDLADNFRLDSVPVDVLGDLPSLTWLSFGSASLTTLEAGTFDGTPALEFLNLERNDLVSLPAGIFDGLVALLDLDLGFNDIEALPAGIFDSLGSLQTLDIGFSELSTLPEGIFSALASLTTLGLVLNNFVSLQPDVFDGLAALETLDLGGNSLLSLPSGIFGNAPALKELDLGGNELTTLPAGLFDELEFLETLSLRANDDLSCLPSTSDSTTVTLPDNVGETCECPTFPTCDEDGEACECQSGEEGYSCVGSSSDVVRAFSCPSPVLVDAAERTTVVVEASAFDERTSGSGCGPNGCTPDNTRDDSLDGNSRWSCKGDLVEGAGGCCIEYDFEEPQDIVTLNIAFHKGTERIRTLNVYDNGNFFSQIKSSGTTNGYQEFALNSDETADLTLCLDGSESNGDQWLSITEVQFMVA